MVAFVFVLGLAVGSFINVLAVRYEPDKFLFHKSVIGGRSRCPRCGRELQWFELIPILSFALQLGRCRTCRTRLSFQYPLVEFLSGLIFVFAPLRISTLFLTTHTFLFPLFSFLFILVFLTLLLISLIDLRLNLIPDEANAFLLILGVFILFTANYSLSTHHFPLFTFPSSLSSFPWLNHLAALAVGALFFGLLIAITRGRAMGMGDMKLGAVLGFIFGWPNIILLIILAFVIGAVFAVGLMIVKKKTLKSLLPFGPFLAAAAAMVFFFGERLAAWYFSLFKI